MVPKILLDLQRMNQNTVSITSFYMSNASPSLVNAQAKVFEKLKIPIQQVCESCSHGEFLTAFLRKQTEDVQAVVFFDIDCVPLDAEKLWAVVQKSVAHQLLIGCAQQANHFEQVKYWRWCESLSIVARGIQKLRRGLRKITGKLNPPYRSPFMYIGPCFMIVPMNTYREIGAPSLEAEPPQFDVAGRLTHEWTRNNKKCEFLWPSNCEIPKYRYGDTLGFGLGTTFGDLVYHAFESTYVAGSESANRFIARCNTLLSNSTSFNEVE